MSMEVEGIAGADKESLSWGAIVAWSLAAAFLFVVGCGAYKLWDSKQAREALAAESKMELAAFAAEFSKTPVVPSAQAKEIAASLMPTCFLEGVTWGGSELKTWLNASDIHMLKVTPDRRILAVTQSSWMPVPIPVEAPSVRLLEEVAVALTARVDACRPAHAQQN